MALEHEFTFIISHIMPRILRVTTLYVAFSLIICAASNVFPRLEAWFDSTTAKTIPFFLIAALVEPFI